MPTVSRGLPTRPLLDIPKREARELLRAWRAADPAALDRIRRRHPQHAQSDDATLAAAPFRLADAQLVLAREYGFANWTALKQRIELHPHARAIDAAIRADDHAALRRLLHDHPPLLHLPIRSGNWGPPMSHAANLGRLACVQIAAELGGKDIQHAFDRALLQGQIECARWLHAQGTTLAPGIVMGSCETLNPAGLRFLADVGAPFTDHRGDRLAPLALVLGTYSRNPAGKHAVLALLAEQSYQFPDTPLMAFHRGDAARLRAFLRTDSALVHRRFALREIYPPELGCPEDPILAGMHGTPIAGTTLLHLAIDFDEREIFDLLLAHGADANARALVDAAGFGGHTPLFNLVVGCPRQDGAGMAQALLAHGADPALRASVRKFLDWQEVPAWHLARDVTPLEWARGFPHADWVNEDAARLLA